MTAGTSQEALWVLKAQSGDREAFGRLLEAVAEPLRRYIGRLIDDRAMSEDVRQDVFVLIHRKLGWLEDPRLFRPWVFRIASREAFRRLKRERRWRDQVRDEELLKELPTEAAPPASVEPVLLARVVAGLSPASRAVLALHYYEGLTLVQIGDVLEIPPGTVKSRLAYGLECLRRELATNAPEAARG